MLFFVPTPLGNLSDISLHVLDIFNKCDVFICEDTRVTKRLLVLLAGNKIIQDNFPNINVKNKRFYSFHTHNQAVFLSNLTPNFFNCDVVFCTDAGMPSISDPGSLLVRYARINNIKYEIVLGGCAFSHAFVCSGLEGSFCFFGFFPHKQHDRQRFIKQLVMYHKALHIVLYESPKRLKDTLSDISLVLPNANVYVYKELTKLYQAEYIGRADSVLGELPDIIKGEYCIVIEKECRLDSRNGEESSAVLCLTQDDIIKLDMPLKQKAKLLTQISSKSTKEWYSILMQEK